MGIVIDTNVFIDANYGKLDLDRLSSYTKYGDAFIAAITASSLLAGAQLALNEPARVQRSAFAEGVLAAIPLLEFNESVARCYSDLYASHINNHKESTLNTHELQIAATGVAHGFPVLSNRPSVYQQIPGLHLLPM